MLKANLLLDSSFVSRFQTSNGLEMKIDGKRHAPHDKATKSNNASKKFEEKWFVLHEKFAKVFNKKSKWNEMENINNNSFDSNNG